MARVHVAFSTAMAGAPVLASNPQAAETLTSGATAVESTITAGNSHVAIITVDGGPVWVAIGKTAAANEAWLMLDGQTREFGLVAPGSKISVLDA